MNSSIKSVLGITAVALVQSLSLSYSAEVIEQKDTTTLTNLGHLEPPAFDQGDLGSGTACAVVTAIMVKAMKYLQAQDTAELNNSLTEYYQTRDFMPGN